MILSVCSWGITFTVHSNLHLAIAATFIGSYLQEIASYSSYLVTLVKLLTYSAIIVVKLTAVLLVKYYSCVAPLVNLRKIE